MVLPRRFDDGRRRLFSMAAILATSERYSGVPGAGMPEGGGV